MNNSITFEEQKWNTDPYSIQINRKLNEPATLSFSILKTGNEENANFKIGEVVGFEDLIFIVDRVNEVVEEGTEKRTVDVSCEQNCMNLSRIYMDSKVFIKQSPIEIFNYILENTGWSVGNHDMDGITMTYYIREKDTVMNCLLAMLKRMGAVCIFRKDTIDIYMNYGKRLVVNNCLIANTPVDGGDIITRMYGRGIKNDEGNPLTFSDLNDGKDYVEDYSYFLKLGYSLDYILDNPAIFYREEYFTDEAIGDAQELLDKTKRELAKKSRPIIETTMTASVDDETEIDLNYSYKIWDSQTDELIDTRVTSISRDYDDKLTLNVTLTSEIMYGDYLEDMIERVNDMQDAITDIQEDDTWSQVLQSAKDHASELIRTGFNGYVVVNSNEILIMDTDDKDTARNVWRWNANGFGYSSTGYNGTYGTAITMDGQIVADYITTGNLDAAVIRSGMLSSLNGATWINMEDGTFSFGGKVGFDGENFYMTLTDEAKEEVLEGVATEAYVTSSINSSLEGLSVSFGKTYATKEEYKDYTDEAISDVTTTLEDEYATKTEVQDSIEEAVEDKPTVLEMNSAINASASNLTSSFSATYATKREAQGYADDAVSNRPTITQVNSAISQSADNINLSVSQKVGKNELISSINTSAESVKISTSKLEIDGNTFLNGSLTFRPYPTSTDFVSLYATGGAGSAQMIVALGGNQKYGEFDVISTSTGGAKYFWVNYEGTHISNNCMFHTDASGVGYNGNCKWDNGYYYPVSDNKGAIGKEYYRFNQGWFHNLRTDKMVIDSTMTVGGNVIFNGGVSISNAELTASYLGSTGNMACNGNLSCQGTVNAASGLTCSYLSNTGYTALNETSTGSLTVKGSLSSTGSISCDSPMYFQSTKRVIGSTSGSTYQIDTMQIRSNNGYYLEMGAVGGTTLGLNGVYVSDKKFKQDVALILKGVNRLFGKELENTQEIKNNFKTIRDSIEEYEESNKLKDLREGLTGLELINTINHYTFNMKENYNDVGYIAQEMPEQFTRSIQQRDEEGNPIDEYIIQIVTDRMFPHITLAIQELTNIAQDQEKEINNLKEKIDTQEKTISEQQSKIDDLEARIAKLEELCSKLSN